MQESQRIHLICKIIPHFLLQKLQQQMFLLALPEIWKLGGKKFKVLVILLRVCLSPLAKWMDVKSWETRKLLFKKQSWLCLKDINPYVCMTVTDSSNSKYMIMHIRTKLSLTNSSRRFLSQIGMIMEDWLQYIYCKNNVF